MEQHGVRNIGNTCCFNTFIQCLYNIALFRTYFKSYKNTNGDPFCQAVQDVMCASPEHYEVAVHRLILQIGNRCDLRIGVQHDADEIFHLFVDHIDRVNRVSQNLPAEARTFHDKCMLEWRKCITSIAGGLFTGMKLNQIRCLSCAKRTHIYEPYMSLQCPFPHAHVPGISVQDLLEKEFEEKLIDDERTCDHCKAKRSSQVARLWKPPPVLVVSLKRFQNDLSGHCWKRQDAIKINIDLDLTDIKACLYPKNNKYRLRAIACHMGGVRSGHYYAQILKENQWWIIDDESVQKCNGSSEQDSYVLFYERVESS